MSWTAGTIVGFDLETTSHEPEEARIVSAALIELRADGTERASTWTIDPGVPVPAEAAAVHGFTTARVRAEGVPAARGIRELIASLTAVQGAGTPMAAYNGRFDFTVLDREARRHGLNPLQPQRILDPLILDKQFDRYRRGSRTLTAACAQYGVPLLVAHDASADARAAAELARVIGGEHRLGHLALDELHALQVSWAAEQAESLQEWFMQKGRVEIVHGEWPVITAIAAARRRPSWLRRLWA